MNKSFNQFVKFIKNKKAIDITIVFENNFKNVKNALRFIKEPVIDGLQKLWSYEYGFGTNTLDFLTDKRLELVGWIAYIGDRICIYPSSITDLEFVATGTYSETAKAMRMFADVGIEVNTLNAKSSDFDFVHGYAVTHILSVLLAEANNLHKAGKLHSYASNETYVDDKAQELFLRGETAKMFDEEDGLKIPSRNRTWDTSQVERKINEALTMDCIANMMLQKSDWDKALVDALLSDENIRGQLADGYTFCDKVNEKIEEIKTSQKPQYVTLRQRVAIKEAIPDGVKNVTVEFMGTDKKTHSVKFPADCFRNNSRTFYLSGWECSASDRITVKLYAGSDIYLQDIVSISYRGKIIWEKKQ